MHTSLRYLQEEMPSMNKLLVNVSMNEQISLGRACLHAVGLPVYCITGQTDSDEWGSPDLNDSLHDI